MITVMNEGVTVSPEHNAILTEIAEFHFRNNTPFVYITHRINSYAVNPSVYRETSKIPNLAGFAVVSKNPIQKQQTKVEKVFFDKDFQDFEELEEALSWKDEIIKSFSKKISQK
ncbi:hypothetical protein [Aquimarina brevivitae]|nr:hypothetical protein [Aquimarina brevivitae]